jgi:predicted RNA polymerase sigma factor
VSEKQWDKRIVERVLELINAGAHEDVVDAYLLTAGLKHAHAKRDVLGRFKQEKKKEATTDRLRAKLASRKSGVGYVG